MPIIKAKEKHRLPDYQSLVDALPGLYPFRWSNDTTLFCGFTISKSDETVRFVYSKHYDTLPDVTRNSAKVR